MTQFDNTVIPYFAWDRKLTAGDIKRRLKEGTGEEKLLLTAWLLREAAFADVWQFLSPGTVAELLPDLSSHLGRKKDFWNYMIRTWHELGKI